MPAVDNLWFQMDIRCMLKRGSGFLLIVLWVILSGFDALEELDLPSGIELHSSIDALLAGEQTGRLVNNSVESADHSRIRHSALLDQPTTEVSVDNHSLSARNFKLHKLHRVFLI